MKADAGVAALQVYPQRVWAFAAWAAPASTTTGTAGSGISVGVAL